MRRLSYTTRRNKDCEPFESNGTVVDLLESRPLLFIDGLLPPRRVLNELLSRGSHKTPDDACNWEPFTLTEREFEVLVAAFARREPATVFVEPPSWVSTLGEWGVWVEECLYGLPAKQRVADLREKLAPLQAELSSADANGDRKCARAWTKQMVAVIREWGQPALEARKGACLRQRAESNVPANARLQRTWQLSGDSDDQLRESRLRRRRRQRWRRPRR